MQATSYVAPPSSFPSLTLPPTKSLASLRKLDTLKCPSLKAATTYDISTVDYSSISSVFPAEVCEVIGGDACDVEMFPEAKLIKTDGRNIKVTTRELVDREYLDYNDPKTVFLEEACDDLGGEFCEPDYKTELK
ncbi:Light regulated Lir1 [Sesbania bispinosa]|nr:Light regulated Lir1 [Sesbania bispinosa]